MSDLFGNHIVGFATRRLKYHKFSHDFFSIFTAEKKNQCILHLHVFVMGVCDRCVVIWLSQCNKTKQMYQVFYLFVKRESK